MNNYFGNLKPLKKSGYQKSSQKAGSFDTNGSPVALFVGIRIFCDGRGWSRPRGGILYIFTRSWM